MVKRVLLLLNMEVREDMSAAIITAIIRPRSPVEGGNISLCLGTAGWTAPTTPSAHPQMGFGDAQLHPVAPGPPPSPGFAVGGHWGRGCVGKNPWERGHDLPLGISSTTSLG